MTLLNFNVILWCDLKTESYLFDLFCEIVVLDNEAWRISVQLVLYISAFRKCIIKFNTYVTKCTRKLSYRGNIYSVKQWLFCSTRFSYYTLCKQMHSVDKLLRPCISCCSARIWVNETLELLFAARK